MLALCVLSLSCGHSYGYSSEYFTQDQTYDEVNNWTVSVNIARKSCLVSASFKNSAQIYIGGDRSRDDLKFYLMVASESWWFSEGKSYKVRVTLDGRKVWSGSGEGVVTYTLNGVSIEGVGGDLITDLARSGAMELTIDGKRYGGFGLSGSRAAVLRMLDCIEEVDKGSISVAAIENTPWFVPDGGEARKETSEADAQPGQEPPRANEGAAGAPKPDEPRKSGRGYSSGTGFFVNREGYLLTNAHVVEGCTDAFVRQNNTGFVPATIVAQDKINDLAALKINQTNAAYAKFRGVPPVRLGDSVVVFGFPLIGVLSKTGNLSTGLVSSLAGIADDITKIQISAPIQSGNSGGAVVDQSGHVVGVVVSKANLQDNGTSDHPQIEVVQNANFAIKAGVAQFFLDVNQVHYDVETPGDDLTVPDIAAAAKEFSAQVMCEFRN